MRRASLVSVESGGDGAAVAAGAGSAGGDAGVLEEEGDDGPVP